VEKCVQYIRDRVKEHLDWTVQLCRIPSVSTRPEHKADVARAAHWTRDLCEKIGLKARVMETGGHPLVYAEWCNAPGAPTFLVYGHVDVQPIGDAKLWDADAFEPTIKGDWLICRGSADDKGQVLLYLRAAAAWLATEKRLPINLRMLIEGEEEIGSPHLGAFIQNHRDLLKCDAILISDTGMHEDGWPTITVSTRGLVYKEVKLTGPRKDLHSGSYGGSLANPATVLAEIIASLHDADGRVTIPGFYEQVMQPTSEIRAQLAALKLDEKKYAAELGVAELTGEKGFTAMERRSIRPTLEVNGIYGGYMGEGANTIIPSKAGAKISMRLVPHQPAEKIAQRFDETIRARCPGTVKLEILTHGRNADAYVAPPNMPGMKAAERALRETFGKDVAFLREGGTLPILPMFRQVLNADCLMLGFASPDCGAHGPNEKVRLPDLDHGAEAITRLFGYLGK
jgi:acetylornithine deacetylase/succinyl-diaminopimelate desuccinylase-like protein